MLLWGITRLTSAQREVLGFHSGIGFEGGQTGKNPCMASTSGILGPGRQLTPRRPLKYIEQGTGLFAGRQPRHENARSCRCLSADARVARYPVDRGRANRLLAVGWFVVGHTKNPHRLDRPDAASDIVTGTDAPILNRRRSL